MVTAALLYVLGHSENTTRDLRCFLEVPAGSGPRRFLLQSPGSGPNHTVHAQSVATAGPQGHHPAACRAHSPLPSQAACHTSPEPRVRVLKGRARTRESGSVLLGQACPAWHTCVCHACARTPPPSGPRGPLCVLGARASASPALVRLHAAPTPPMPKLLDAFLQPRRPDCPALAQRRGVSGGGWFLRDLNHVFRQFRWRGTERLFSAQFNMIGRCLWAGDTAHRAHVSRLPHTKRHTAPTVGPVEGAGTERKTERHENPRVLASHPHRGPKGSSESHRERHVCCGDGAAKTYTLLVEMQNSGATRGVLQKHPRRRPSSSGSAQEKGKSCEDARSSIVRERPEGETMRRVDEWSVHSWLGDTPGRWEGKSTDARGTV
ncbi:unnamed protein product [Rangifer tarandus platyrhynchus]|uniref:Uncharacterized protein n=1 Tax=Rangifer tarandus platyrhynchus TaxID=3082113 RepID=A0AC59YF85_RANTA